MSPAHVFEPTYVAIKRRLMNGEWEAGIRLEAAKIAETLGVSMTPVRDCLNRLAGERLVDFTAGEGFYVHQLSEAEYRDMLELHLILLLAAIATAQRVETPLMSSVQDYPDRIAGFFTNLAARSSNAELTRSIAALGDRLHRSRHYDAGIIGDTAAEFDALEAWVSGSAATGDFRTLLLRYHERRAACSADYARAMAPKVDS